VIPVAMALNTLTLPELRERLQSHGETAPRAWSKTQVLLRLVELEGEGNLRAGCQPKSPLRALEIKINQASRKKSVLQELATQELGLSITGNETIEILKLKAMEKALMIAEPHAEDYVAFGQWCHLKYVEVMMQQPGYCEWVMKTAAEGDCCTRLRRLANWLEHQKAILQR